jgi:hypothetical protein
MFSWREARDREPLYLFGRWRWPPSPLATILVAILIIFALGYSFGGQQSQSERIGTITPNEAKDGVTPSLSPYDAAAPLDQGRDTYRP